MNSSSTSLFAAAFATVALFGHAAHAAVILVDTDSANTTNNGSPGAFTLTDEGPGNRDGIYSYSYNAGASFDMLVVTVSREASSTTQNTNNATFSVSYDGVDMDLATGDEAGSGVTIYYLATSAQSGSIALDFTDFATLNGVGIGIAAIESANGNPLALIDADSGTGTSIPIEPTLDNSFTLFAIDTNLNAFSDLTSPLTQIVKNVDVGSNGYAVGYDEDVAAGSISYSYTNTNSPRGIAAANFATIPEPSGAALLGLGGLLLFRRRR